MYLFDVIPFTFRYIPNPEFNPNVVRQVSSACEGLCRWVRAMEVYDRVIKIVSPKRIKLREAQIELGLQMKRLSQKHQQLQQVLHSIFLKIFANVKRPLAMF